MPTVEEVQKDFADSLDLIIDNVQFVASAYRVAAYLQTHLPAPGGDPGLLQVANTFKYAPRVSENITLEGGVIIIAAHFEFYVRETIEAACNDLQNRIGAFDKLNERIRLEHVKATGKILSNFQRYKNSDSTHDYLDMSRRLGTCVPGAPKFEFNSRAMSHNENNMTEGELTQIFIRIGLENFWDIVSRQQALRNEFNTPDGPKTKTQATKALNEFMRLRNSIVHANLNHIQIGPDTLTIFQGFFKSLSTAITRTTLDHCAQF